MRDRVALSGASALGIATRFIRTVLVLTAVPAVLVLGMAEFASADTPGSEQLPFSVAGPVGIGAVVLGIGGLVAGLMRRRRTPAARPVRMPGPAAPLAAERVAADDRAA